MYQNLIKPLLDFLTALIGLLVLSPIFIIVTLLLAIANQGKPFFFQQRPGQYERIFKIIKFKTMNDKRGEDGQLLPDSDRLTAVGKFVRKTSLDEVPQLINVLKGDMSLVGPRPLLPEYLPLYNDQQRKRHEVKPGITGWAQVNGRNALSWQGKFEKDVDYVNKQSFMFDLQILILTLKKVIKSEGINQGGQATAQKFEGNRNRH
ncbi:sugar transferase [Psychroflexus sp. CAK8W]|uniref:Sugar transferase n=1 Tax=Psychroflexus longus TaxID=2873596 RepID=A0ABS7XFG9_9FLAO|nr:sugar transferase [Psychroflexus longus]MBZ9777705.1 sugar transferase [Psychroflexus longus]